MEPVWLQGVTGCNSIIAVVDDGENIAVVAEVSARNAVNSNLLHAGVEYMHPGFSSNYVRRDRGRDRGRERGRQEGRCLFVYIIIIYTSIKKNYYR